MPDSTTCQSCGGPLALDSLFCPACGAAAAGADAVAAATVLAQPTNPDSCVACGSPVAGTANFCPHCGATRLEGATVPSQGSLERITAERLSEATTGEFEILERIGHGAMGSVYLARDVALTRRVAIKVISPQLLADETMVARFRLEAQTVAALRHPHIVNLHGVRQLGDLHFFIMDFIDGTPLRSLMKAHAPLDISVVQALLFQIGSALSYAHRRGRGVIHRDVKPANVMVDREGNAVVMDFGISKVGQAQSGLTQTGATIGTPEYMSPEQCMDRELTGASDQYALGIVAYEMITGAVPFKGSSYATMMAHASTPPPPIQEVRPDCPPEVEASVMRMLAKDPDDRFPDLDAAAAALGGAPIGHGDPIRDNIISLVDSVSTDAPGLDASSPLSPIPAEAEPVSIVITGLPDALQPGDRFDLRVEPRDRRGSPIAASSVEWTMSDPTVASVEDGTFVARAAGAVSLTATVGHVANTVLLTVGEPKAVEVSVRPRSVTIAEGGSIGLRADVLDRDGNELDRAVDWTSQDEARATVSTTGIVSAISAGRVTITAAVDGADGTAQVEVEQVAEQAPSPPAPTRASATHTTVESTDEGEARRTDEEETVHAGTTWLWKAGVGASALALVAFGLVQALGDSSADASGEPGALSLSVVDDTLVVGDTLRITASFDAGDAEAAPTSSATWASSNPAAADVDRRGLVSTRGVGSTVITASLNGVQVTANLVVMAASDAVATAALGAPPQDGPGARAGGERVPPEERSNPGGSARPREQAAGSGAPATGDQRRPPAPSSVVVRVRIEGAERPILPGESIALRATALDADGAVIEAGAIVWTSSDETIARVNAGNVEASGVGTARISALIGGVAGTADLTVEAPALEPPTRTEVLQAAQRFVGLLSSLDTTAVRRLFRGDGGATRREVVVERMREASFSARLTRMGDPIETEDGVTVDFDVQLSWRGERGARNQRSMSFQALLEPRAASWRLASVRRLAAPGGLERDVEPTLLR